MKNMNISDMEAFLAIAETRNVSKAAEMLFVTQSTISHRLKALESELNLHLVERSRGARVVELTPKGKQLVSIAQRWVTLWKEAQQLREAKSYTHLVVAQVDWFSAYPFSRLYRELSLQAPQVKLDIKTGHSVPIYEMVNNMEADIGLVVRAVTSNTITCVPLFRDPLVLVTSKSVNPMQSLVNPQWLDVRNEVFWGYFGDFRFWHDQWWDSNVMPYMSLDFSPPMSFELLEHSSRWLVSPRSIAELMVARLPDLSIHTFTTPPPDLIVYLIFRNKPRESAALSAEMFVDFIKENVSILTCNKDYMLF